MNYGQTAEAPKPSSLIGESANINNRLNEILSRIVSLGDALHGSEPRDISPATGQAAPPPNALRRNIDATQTLCSQIENSLARIEQRL